MNTTAIRQNFSNINCWKSKGVRAPHKPLLLLLMLGKYQRGEQRLQSFREIRDDLTQLLTEFGPNRKSNHPEYPFWRLQNDGIWELENAENCESRTGNTDAKVTELLKYDVKGGLNQDIHRSLGNSEELTLALANILLDSAFSESLHSDILSAVGLELYLGRKSKRDPNFRKAVLSIYSYQCAVCGYGIRFNDSVIGLEAAHIKWHQAGGPDIEQNGMALCSLHHKLFDYGAFTLNEERQIVLSRDVHGSKSDEHLIQFQGAHIASPHNVNLLPKIEFLKWHQKEVFKAPGR